jgi:hypothetical protein
MIAEPRETPGGLIIETRFRGYHFRSRLEARWFAFFEAIGVRAEYEPQGFVTSSGAYLPDFFVNEWRTWIEIKPWLAATELASHCCKLRDVEKATSQCALVVYGPPDLIRGAMIFSSLGSMVASHFDRGGPRSSAPEDLVSIEAYTRAQSERFNSHETHVKKNGSKY